MKKVLIYNAPLLFATQVGQLLGNVMSHECKIRLQIYVLRNIMFEMIQVKHLMGLEAKFISFTLAFWV